MDPLAIAGLGAPLAALPRVEHRTSSLALLPPISREALSLRPAELVESLRGSGASLQSLAVSLRPLASRLLFRRLLHFPLALLRLASSSAPG